jgi:hypothetical protein
MKVGRAFKITRIIPEITIGTTEFNTGHISEQ